MKNKTKIRAEAGADLAKLVLEEIPVAGAVMKGARVTRDAYRLATGRDFPLPPGVMSMERMERRIPRRFR